MADNLNSGQTASDTQAVILASTTKQDISQARQVQLDAASDVLLRSATLKSTGSPTLSDLTATNIYYKPDGTLVIVTQSGKEVTTNRDDQEFYAEKNNERTLIVREQNNEIEAYKVWAQEQGYYKLGQTDFIRSLSDLQKDPYYKDFQRYGSELESRTGIKPFSTPYQNYLDNKTLQDTTLEDTPRTRYPQASVVDPFVNSGRRVTGSAALASDELAALKRAIGTNNSNQQQVNQQLGLAPISTGRQAAAFFAQRASDSARYGPDVSQEPDTVNNRYSDAQQENSDMANLDQANQIESTDGSGAAPRQVQLRPNPLDDYESYSYTISLHVLTQDEYNSMVSTDKTGTFIPSNTLIAGAGAGVDSSIRAKGWEDNFYFESLKLSSVIGLNSTARGTNVIDCEFTIVEPYGLSLIDRLSVTTSTLGGGGLYFSNCYLIEINFYSSEGGKLMDMKKFIPIRLTGMTIKASAKGSEYRCTAVPFSHHALTQTRASTPANFEVTAGTLQEFFQGDDSSSSQAAAEGARELTEAQNVVQGSFERTGEARKVDQDKLASLSDKVYAVNSYVAAYNQWQQTLIDLKATQLSKPNKITVVFDKKFLENDGSKVYRPRDQDGSVGTSAMANGPSSSYTGDKVRANATKDRFIFAAGTQITEVINIAMKQSEFIRRQIVQQDQAKAGGQKEVQGKVTWWKIIPSVKLQEFDEKNNQWSFDSTYYVIPYQVWNTVHPFLPKAIPDRGLCSKEYMYYYTGQNVNVIDFAIDFDFMFFTKVTALREKNTGDQYKAELDENPEISAPNSKVKKGEGFNPGVITHVTDDPKTAGQKARGDPIAMAVASASESLYSSAAGEMLNITLKIIGDPELIKQDDVFTGVTALLEQNNTRLDAMANEVSTASANGSLTSGVAFQIQNNYSQPQLSDPTKNNNNSIVMDSSEVVCWVEIKTPVDIDDQTGGVRFLDNNKVKSGFTGVYKLLMVDSEFNRGMFTQTLNMIRYMNQDFAPVEDRSYDQAEANRLSNYSDNSAQQPSGNNSSQVKIGGLAGPGEELTIEQTNAVIINKITSPTWTATPLPGGQLVEYRTTVR